MIYTIKEMDKGTAERIAQWKYEEPYALYSMDGSKEEVQEFMSQPYYSVFKDNELIGYFCFGSSAQVPAGHKIGAYEDKDYIDVGLGLNPKFCGKGYGHNFFRCGLDYASNLFSTDRFRLTVAKFNQRAIKVYKKLGCIENNISFMNTSNKGDIEFIIMTLQDLTDSI